MCGKNPYQTAHAALKEEYVSRTTDTYGQYTVDHLFGGNQISLL